MDVRGENDKPGAEENAAQDTAVRLTPMMEQYIEIKAANVDSLLF